MKNVTVSNSNNTVAVPSEFICPITMEIMVHPVLTRFGHCFERTAIMTWMGSSVGSECECPLTRKPLRISDMINNHSLGERIKAWCDDNNYPTKLQVNGTPPTTDDSNCDGHDDDISTPFFVSADLKTIKARADQTTLARSQSLRHPTASSDPTLPRTKRNFIRMVVSWTHRT